MTSEQARLTAMITTVEQEAQDEARVLAGEGRTARAIRRLRKNSGLNLLTGSLALDLMVQGGTLPTTHRQALDVLRESDAALVAQLTDVLGEGKRDSDIKAVKLLRERTGIDLAGGYHIVQELAAQLGR
ncbi:hypothetical protein [Streptomyces sp. NPDC050546]|uniref:hypothetical protein n=1 Tax=Streptomyces sp. NPDC050546 TaxID=3365628 RepID=UPI0037BCBEF6